MADEGNKSIFKIILAIFLLFSIFSSGLSAVIAFVVMLFTIYNSYPDFKSESMIGGGIAFIVGLICVGAAYLSLYLYRKFCK